jgi:hypothetical protein
MLYLHVSGKQKTKTSFKSRSDSSYFLKLVIIVILGCFWVKIASPGNWQVPIPVGLIIGLYLIRKEKFALDRKIQYGVLLVAMLNRILGPGRAPYRSLSCPESIDLNLLSLYSSASMSGHQSSKFNVPTELTLGGAGLESITAEGYQLLIDRLKLMGIEPVGPPRTALDYPIVKDNVLARTEEIGYSRTMGTRTWKALTGNGRYPRVLSISQPFSSARRSRL